MELVSLAEPGATFCKNNNKNGSWLKKQVETFTTKDDNSATHAIFLGVTDLIETKGEGKLKNLFARKVPNTSSVAKNIKEWIKCIKDQVVSFLN